MMWWAITLLIEHNFQRISIRVVKLLEKIQNTFMRLFWAEQVFENGGRILNFSCFRIKLHILIL